MRNDNYMEYMDGKRRFLTFMLQNEHYGIDILNVSEIIATLKITPIPNTPSYVEGVINLRGSIIPVIDLRRKFGLKHKKADLDTAIIISVIFNLSIGLIVDQVEDVVTLEKNEITEVSPLAQQSGKHFLDGIANVGNNVMMVVGIEKMLDNDLFSLLEHNEMAAAS